MLEAFIPVIVLILGAIGWVGRNILNRKFGWGIANKINNRIERSEEKNTAEHATNLAISEANAARFAAQDVVLRTIQDSIADLASVVRIQTSLSHAVQTTINHHMDQNDATHAQIIKRQDHADEVQGKLLEWVEDHADLNTER